MARTLVNDKVCVNPQPAEMWGRVARRAGARRCSAGRPVAAALHCACASRAYGRKPAFTASSGGLAPVFGSMQPWFTVQMMVPP